jgi:hypothetical protein
MATKKIVQGKEMYASKAAMMKHEKSEPLKKQMKEDMAMMAKGGAVVAKAPMKKGAKSPALAIVIGMGKPKGKTMMNNGGMAKPMMYSKGGMAKGKKC